MTPDDEKRLEGMRASLTHEWIYGRHAAVQMAKDILLLLDASERARNAALERAENAEAALAEERKGGPRNYVHKSMFDQVERAEKAEARVEELTKDLEDLQRFTGQTIDNMRSVRAWVAERMKAAGL